MPGLSSTARVLDALRGDERRQTQRSTWGAFSSYASEHHASEQDLSVDAARLHEDSAGDAGHHVVRAPSEERTHNFRRAVYRVMQDTRNKQNDKITVRAVAHRAKNKFQTAYQDLESPSEQIFVSNVLKALPLMLKETAWLREIRELLFRRKRGNPNETLSKVSEVMYNLKVVTARLCWSTHIGPTEEKLAKAEARFHELQSQFMHARSSYLQEVSNLRDELRQRQDPDSVLGKAGDIKLFWDPAQSLREEELEFVSQVVKEKLKMILERGSHGSINLDQLAALESKVMDKENEGLKVALSRQIKENGELQQKLQVLSKVGGQEVQNVIVSSKSGSATRMVQILEDKVEALRTQLEECQRGDSGRLRQERGELQQAYEDEMQDRIRLQEQVGSLTERVEHAEAAAELAREERAEALQRLERSSSDAKGLSREVDRVQMALQAAAAKQWRGNLGGRVRGSGGTSSEPEGEAEPAQSGSPTKRQPFSEQREGKSHFLGDKADGEASKILTQNLNMTDPALLEYLAESEAKAHQTQLERSRLASENDALRGQCSTLQRELDTLRHEDARRCSEAAATEAAHLREISRIVEIVGDGAGAPNGVEAMENFCRDADQKQQELDALKQRAEQVAEELDKYEALDVSSASPETVDRVHELQLEARNNEFGLFIAEVTLEAARWAEEAKSISIMNGPSQSSQDLLQRIASHCERLQDKVEHSTSVSLQLAHAVNELQAHALAAAAALKTSEAARQDQSLQAEVVRLEEAASSDLVREASASAERPSKRTMSVKNAKQAALQVLSPLKSKVGMPHWRRPPSICSNAAAEGDTYRSLAPSPMIFLADDGDGAAEDSVLEAAPMQIISSCCIDHPEQQPPPPATPTPAPATPATGRRASAGSKWRASNPVTPACDLPAIDGLVLDSSGAMSARRRLVSPEGGGEGKKAKGVLVRGSLVEAAKNRLVGNSNGGSSRASASSSSSAMPLAAKSLVAAAPWTRHISA